MMADIIVTIPIIKMNDLTISIVSYNYSSKYHVFFLSECAINSFDDAKDTVEEA